ncbi:MAG TPA: molybdopterin-binding protein, partial [Pirellulales bacterium]|nr:molybdopterin-binding protein [Pirellulales bacterium]
ANVQVFRQAAQRADLVIATGGLGPTADDLTREALAAAAGVELVLDPTALERIEGLFSQRKRPMPLRNKVQAMFPRGSRVIPNPAGTAPGIDIELPRQGGSASRIFALPGVPAEMREMWQQTVAPTISAMLGSPRVIRHKQIKCFGVGESDLEAMLPDLIRRGRDPQVGITVHGATITLRITAAGESPEECYRAMEPTVATIHACLGDLVFGEGDDELEHAVLRLLTAQKKTLATAEWGSGGMIATWLADVPPSRGSFLGGIVVQNHQALAALLATESCHDSSSSEHERIVSEMAQKCREKLRTDYGLAVGELPRINPQVIETPLLHFAVAGPSGTKVRSSPYAGHPDILKTRGGKQALNLLRLTLLHSRE